MAAENGLRAILSSAVLGLAASFSPQYKMAAEMAASHDNIGQALQAKLKDTLPNLEFEGGRVKFTVDMSGMNLSDMLHYSDLLAGETHFSSSPINKTGIMVFTRDVGESGIAAAANCAGVVATINKAKANITTLLDNVKECREESSQYQLKPGEYETVEARLKEGVKVTGKSSDGASIA